MCAYKLQFWKLRAPCDSSVCMGGREQCIVKRGRRSGDTPRCGTESDPRTKGRCFPLRRTKPSC
eukprot:2359098-Pleurochrysis_carterae.AAC.1